MVDSLLDSRNNSIRAFESDRDYKVSWGLIDLTYISKTEYST